MRSLVINEKDLVMLGIPPELIMFMTEVHQHIVDGDEAAVLESDDLLQCVSCYGGLINKGNDLYGFTYFPEKNVRVKCELLLSSTQIQEISTGKLQLLQLWRCKDTLCGSAFTSSKDSCFNCDWE